MLVNSDARQAKASTITANKLDEAKYFVKTATLCTFAQGGFLIVFSGGYDRKKLQINIKIILAIVDRIDYIILYFVSYI